MAYYKRGRYKPIQHKPLEQLPDDAYKAANDPPFTPRGIPRREILMNEFLTDEEKKANLRGGRTPGQREHDLVDVAKMYLHGYSQGEIARKLTDQRTYVVTPAVVANDIRLLLKRWQESYLIDFNAAKARELARIDELEQAYWTSWRESTMLEVIETEKIEDSSTSSKGVTVPTYSRGKVKKKEVKSSGAAIYLNGIQWCIEQRCRILGLNAPQKVDVNWREEAAKAGVDAGAMFNELVGRYVQAGTSTDTPGLDGSNDAGGLERGPEDSLR